MRVTFVRHHLEDEPGLLGEAFESRGLEVAVHEGARPGPLPDPTGTDAVVVLGAVWSVYDTATIGSWIGEELEWLRALDAAGVPLLGVCFGAQALAAAHGGSVEPAPRKEIGWVTVEPVRPEVVESGPWFQFHGDRCVPPPGADVLATSDVAVQAYALRRNLAVQFHPEVDAPQLERWLEHGGREEIAAFGLDPDELLAATTREEEAARLRADELVEAFLRSTM
ncbi:MAG: type 1 glutamine amidotransferase [Acidimicrobiales bacterium]